MSINNNRELENTDNPVILFSSVHTWTPILDETKTLMKSMAAPQPPPRTQSSCVRPNVAPPPPPPLPASFPPVPPTRNSSMSTSKGNSASVDNKTNFASQFEALFEPLSNLPEPELFTDCQKLYPSLANRVQRSRRSRPAPQPPTAADKSKPSSTDQAAVRPPDNAASSLIDLVDSEKNLSSFVDESLSKLTSSLTLSNQQSMVDPTARIITTSGPCINCPTCNQIEQSSMIAEIGCQQYPSSCVAGSDSLSCENYQLSAPQEHLDTITTQSATTNYLSSNNFSTSITSTPYEYQYHTTRTPYSYSTTSPYQPSNGTSSLFGQDSYLTRQEKQPSINYNEYFWGPS